MKSDDDVNDFREARICAVEIKSGKLSVEGAMDLYKQDLAHRVILKKTKPSTEEFWHSVLNSIKLSWPELAGNDVSDIKAEECKTWFGKFAQDNSPTYIEQRAACLEEST